MKNIEKAPETGVKIIDAHHIKIFELLNELDSIIQNRTCSPDLPTYMHKLSFFAENYFLDEEAALSQNQFSNLKKHKEEHRHFADKIRDFQQEFASGRKDMCLNLFQFLAEWYNNHVKNYDSEAATFLKSKGY